MLKVAVFGVPPDRVPEPRVVAPSMNVTVPVGMPPLLVTVAVKVTEALYADDADDCVRLVDELPPTTVCVNAGEVDPGRFASPP